jgi:hypothetical protein
MPTTINGPYAITLVLGTGYHEYPGPLTITTYGIIASTGFFPGVYSTFANVSINNAGGVYGGVGVAVPGYADGGAGIQLGGEGHVLRGSPITGGGHIVNTGIIAGGSGYQAHTYYAEALQAGTGGAGVLAYGVTTLTNDYGEISGGSGGQNITINPGGGAAGGAGVQLDAGGKVTNDSGIIAGGAGGQGVGTYIYALGLASRPTGTGGSGGAGVVLDGAGSLNNSGGDISGGAGGYGNFIGGSGGAGVELQSGGPVTNSGTISGGDGGNALGYIESILGSSADGFGGRGGLGVEIDKVATVNNTGGDISGGDGGEGTSDGGAGGTGVQLDSGGGVTNTGTISGGDGGSSFGTTAFLFVTTALTGSGGYGGDGVALGGTANVSNTGTIIGGAGGSANHYGGSGGRGVSQTDGTLTNSTGGSITGGAGGFGNSQGGYGGAGAYVFQGSVINTGGASLSASSIVGGTGGGSDGTGGEGGFGVVLGWGNITNIDGSSIAGGHGGDAVAASGGPPVITGGAGADAVFLVHGALTNASYSNIIGGAGGGAYAIGYSGVTADGGAGGIGVRLIDPDTVTNSGSIEGGDGGYGTTLGGTGGIGVDLEDGRKLVNTGTGLIGGGDGGGASGVGGVGGVGVYLDGGTLITAGTISGGSGTTIGDAVVFGAADGSMVIDPGAVFEGAIGGFTIGDIIDVTNLTPAEVSADHSGDTIAMGGDGTLNFAGIPVGDHFVFSNYGAAGTQITLAEGPCFRRGTRILAERGEVTVESLKIGDRVMTLSGAARPIRWIGRRSYSGEVAWGNREVLPILIRASALADGLPRRDLWVSPEHAMYLDGMLIPAAALVNGVSIEQEESVDELSYYHLEFDSHEVIYAEGAPSESFVDDESRQMFDNSAEYRRLYPNAHREPARFCAPRVEEGEELEAVRLRLAARAPLNLPRRDGFEARI